MWENRTGRTSAPRMEREKDKGEKEGEKVFKLFIHQCERTRFHQSAFDPVLSTVSIFQRKLLICYVLSELTAWL